MKTKIGVVFGGRSTEHEISVISANQAMHAANEDLYEIVPIYLSKDGRWYTGEALMDVRNYKDIPALLKKCEEVYMRPVYDDYKLYKARKPRFGSDVYTTLDVILPVLHGSNGEDGVFEGVLETIGIPFAGCNTLSSANGMDKITMKMILRECGVPVVDYVWFTDREWFSRRDEIIKKIETQLGYPVIVKPANLGSSVGIGCAKDLQSLKAKVDDAAKYSSRIIVEKEVLNLQEINCSVLGDCDDYRLSVLEEPVKSGEILSYADKYMGGSGSAKGGSGAKSRQGMQASQKRIPANLSKEETEKIQYLAGETFRVLSCHGVSRVDMLIDGNSREIFVNEINTIPGSLSFYLWEASGIKFDKLIDTLVGLALKRNREKANKTVSYDQNIFALGGGVKCGMKGAKA